MLFEYIPVHWRYMYFKMWCIEINNDIGPNALSHLLICKNFHSFKKFIYRFLNTERERDQFVLLLLFITTS